MSTDIAQPRAKEIIARIVELQPWLRTQQATAEQERRIPQETIERLDAAGVFSLTKPKRYGGADFNTREMLDIYRALGAGCGASGWVVWATAGGNMWSNAFAEEVVAPQAALRMLRWPSSIDSMPKVQIPASRRIFNSTRTRHMCGMHVRLRSRHCSVPRAHRR